MSGTTASGTLVATIPQGTLVNITIVDHLNSKQSHVGDTFRIALAEPITLDGKVIVPTGAEGRGEVIHAARARAGGKAGELILAARTLEWNGRTMRLRSFGFGRTGESRVTEGAALAYVGGPLVYLVVGGEVDVPSGTPAHAKLAVDIDFGTPSAEQR